MKRIRKRRNLYWLLDEIFSSQNDLKQWKSFWLRFLFYGPDIMSILYQFSKNFVTILIVLVYRYYRFGTFAYVTLVYSIYGNLVYWYITFNHTGTFEIFMNNVTLLIKRKCFLSLSLATWNVRRAFKLKDLNLKSIDKSSKYWLYFKFHPTFFFVKVLCTFKL